MTTPNNDSIDNYYHISVQIGTESPFTRLDGILHENNKPLVTNILRQICNDFDFSSVPVLEEGVF